MFIVVSAATFAFFSWAFRVVGVFINWPWISYQGQRRRYYSRQRRRVVVSRPRTRVQVRVRVSGARPVRIHVREAKHGGKDTR